MERNYIKLIIYLGIVCILFFTSCSSTRILNLSLVSMNNSTTSYSKEIKLKSIGEVKGKHCMTIFESKEMGMMDRIIQGIQDKYKVDYIKNVVVSMYGSDCMEIVGEGMVIQK